VDGCYSTVARAEEGTGALFILNLVTRIHNDNSNMIFWRIRSGWTYSAHFWLPIHLDLLYPSHSERVTPCDFEFTSIAFGILFLAPAEHIQPE
jgi:hypothetical protein